MKAQFRPFAMLPLDTKYIFQMRFYVNGFKESKLLTRKLIQLHQLCADQLSPLEHYDFGVRTMKTILLQAIASKRKFPALNELEILSNAIYKINLPKLIDADLKVFNGIFKQIFPNVSNPIELNMENASSLIRESLKNCLEKRNLQPTDALIGKILQIYQMIEMGHGIVIVGNPMCGKTIAWQVLAETLRDIKANTHISAGDSSFNEYDVTYRIINPKSISLNQLYGHVNAMTLEWCDGVVAKVFREMISITTATIKSRGWIVFDGIVDPTWAEALHTLLDENRKLCLASGQMLEKTPLMSIFFETDTLEFASPATVARCGVVYISQSDDQQWKKLHFCFVNVLRGFGLVDIYITLFETLVDWLILAVLNILQECNGVLRVSPMQQYQV